MVTVVGKTAEGLGVYRGLSTDLPLVPAPKNGSRFFAMDNGKTYWYDAASDTWEGYAGGGGGGGSASDTSFDNEASGLNATNVQGAIDEVVGKMADGAVLVEDYTISETSYSDTLQTRFKNLADLFIAYCQTLASNEYVLISYLKYSQGLMPNDVNKKFDNTTMAFDERFTRLTVNASSGSNYYLRVADTLANNDYFRMDFDQTPSNTINDLKSTTSTTAINFHVQKYKVL